jgi:purine-binding chemotaxis protein CheW
MTGESMEGPDRPRALREAFDQSFADAPVPREAELEDLLCIRLAGSRYALRVAELSGLLADRHVVPLPSPVPELLGITTMRAAILPVYDLRALLGHRTEAKPRWVAVARAARVGVAFDAFECHIRVRRDAATPQVPGERSVRHVRHVVHVDGQLQFIVSLASVLDAIAARVRGRP